MSLISCLLASLSINFVFILSAFAIAIDAAVKKRSSKCDVLMWLSFPLVDHRTLAL